MTMYCCKLVRTMGRHGPLCVEDILVLGVQSHGTNDPLYDGMQSEWIEEEVDLTDYQGQIINLRLYFFSDGFVELDGFYIDDMVIVRNTLVSTSTEDELAAESFTISPSLNDGNFDVHLDFGLDRRRCSIRSHGCPGSID